MIPKFRGRSVEAFSEEEWKYGYLIEDEGYSFIINQVIEANEQYITIGSWCPVNPDTLGQSTGLFDKNGKEIFEGDVVRMRNPRDRRQIGMFQVVRVANSPMLGLLDKKLTTEIFNLYEHMSNYYEVKGNIYENPDLLEAIK